MKYKKILPNWLNFICSKYKPLYIQKRVKFFFKWTVSVISSDPPCKDGNARFTTLPCNRLYINGKTFEKGFFNSEFSTKVFCVFLLQEKYLNYKNWTLSSVCRKTTISSTLDGRKVSKVSMWIGHCPLYLEVHLNYANEKEKIFLKQFTITNKNIRDDTITAQTQRFQYW